MAVNLPIRRYIEHTDNTELPDIRKAPVKELPSARMVKKLTGMTMPTDAPPLPRINIPALRARLYNARKQAGMTPEDVQQATGIRAKRLRYIESVGQRTTTRTVQQLAKLYGVSVEWLCYGTEGDNGNTI